MKTLDDYKQRIKQAQERFEREMIRKRDVFEEMKEKRQHHDHAACQEIREVFVEQTECREQSFHQQQDAHQAERQHLVSQGASFDKKASESDFERFKNRQRLLKDDSR